MFSQRAFARCAAQRGFAVPRVAARGYAAAADTKPPVALFGLDGTYANALYIASVKTNSLEPTAKALASLHNSFKSDAKLASILNAPTLSASDKSGIIKELMSSASVNASSKEGATVKNFLETMAENNRLNQLEGVCDKFGELMSAARGEIELRVTSAAPLDQKVLKQLEGAVSKSKFVGQGKKLRVVSKVQPDIRGGLIVEIGDRTIDLSVASKITKMNKLLTDAL